LVIGAVAIFCSLVFGLVGYYLGIRQNRPGSVSTVSESNPTTIWKTYKNGGIAFEYPPNWIEKPVLVQGSGFTQEFDDPEDKYIFSFSSIGNYNQVTGKPYATIDEFVGMPYKVGAVTADGQEGRQPLPRAGSEDVNSAVFFSVDAKAIYTLELKAVDIGGGRKLFEQILSTLKFSRLQAEPTLAPAKNVKRLTYYLPSGWLTMTDAAGTLEVGYNPKVSSASTVRGVDIELTPNDPNVILRSHIVVRLLPYDGGSRHRFIYESMGGVPIAEERMAGYTEKEYLYGGRSCLFLVGISYSQFPTTWGMCDAGSGRAFLITANGEAYEDTVRTIRLVK